MKKVELLNHVIAIIYILLPKYIPSTCLVHG